MVKYLFLLLLLLGTPAFAAESAGGEILGPGLKALGALVFVIGLILLLYALSRKGFGLLPAAKGGAIEVVEMRSLGPKKGVCLVKVRGKEVLLGIGSDRVEFLCQVGEVEPPPSFEKSLQDTQEEAS